MRSRSAPASTMVPAMPLWAVSRLKISNSLPSGWHVMAAKEWFWGQMCVMERLR